MARPLASESSAAGEELVARITACRRWSNRQSGLGGDDRAAHQQVEGEQRGVDAKGGNRSHPQRQPEPQQQPRADRARQHRHREHDKGIAVVRVVGWSFVGRRQIAVSLHPGSLALDSNCRQELSRTLLVCATQRPRLSPAFGSDLAGRHAWLESSCYSRLGLGQQNGCQHPAGPAGAEAPVLRCVRHADRCAHPLLCGVPVDPDGLRGSAMSMSRRSGSTGRSATSPTTGSPTGATATSASCPLRKRLSTSASRRRHV